MIIAITSYGSTLNSQIDPRFGRSAYFLIGNSEIMDFGVFENKNITAEGDAGINSAKVVINAGAEAVLTGNCGPNAERTIRAAGAKLYTGVKGTISEAIDLFLDGKLKEADGPNVQSHFGTGN